MSSGGVAAGRRGGGNSPALPCRLVAAQDGETAGALMTFFLALGLSLGAALSFPLRALI